MTDPTTFTAEHRSWEWELVLQYEDGSLPASAWNEATLAVVAGWYAKNLSADQAKARYEQYFHRNRHRLTHRLGAVDTAAIEAVDRVWESLLTRVLAAPKPGGMYTPPAPQDAPPPSALSKLMKEHGLTGETRLYREAERASLTPTGAPGRYRLAANAHPSESVIDVYGPGYVMQAEDLGPGLAFAQTATPNWQETMEMRTMRIGANKQPDAGTDRVEVVISLAEILSQGGLMYPVESVTVERAWYFTLPKGSIEVTEVM